MKSKLTRIQIVQAPPDTILTPDEVATWLSMERRELTRLGIPRFAFDGHPKSDRYLKCDVLAWLESQRTGRGKLTLKAS